MKELSALELNQIFLRKWWLIVLLMAAGGFMGLVFHYSMPPVYEARTRLLVNINITNYPLTSREENRVMDAVIAIVNSSEVQENVIATAQASLGSSLTQIELQRKATLERTNQVLEMRIRDRDPILAAKLVNLWAEAAYQRLMQAQEHAVAADQIQRQLDGWLACLPGYVTPTPDPNTHWPHLVPTWNEECEKYSREEIEASIQMLSNKLMIQRRHSLGLVSFLEFAPPEKAFVPDSPVLYERGTTILAGMAIGLLLSIWLVYFRAGRA